MADDNKKGKAATKEQREKLGVAPVPKSKAGSKTPTPEPTDAIQKVEVRIMISILILVKFDDCAKTNWLSNSSLRSKSKMMDFQI